MTLSKKKKDDIRRYIETRSIMAAKQVEPPTTCSQHQIDLWLNCRATSIKNQMK